MSCQSCDDNINQSSVSSGPAGPTGPTGPEPVIRGISTTSVLVGTGSKTFTTQEDIAWATGQRIRAYNPGTGAIMEGTITSYSTTTLILNITYTSGAGTYSDWVLMIAGEIGITGSTGPTGAAGGTGATGQGSYDTLSGSATSLGSDVYAVTLATSVAWLTVGEAVFITGSGYYQVVNLPGGLVVHILNLLYPGNTTTLANASAIVPSGLRGATGATGATGSAGATGPTGPQGPTSSMTESTIATTNVPAQTDLSVIGSASSGTYVLYTGWLELESDAAITITVTPLIAGVAASADYIQTITGPTAVGAKSWVQIPVLGLLLIAPSQAFALRITSDDYTQNTTVNGKILYTYQV